MFETLKKMFRPEKKGFDRKSIDILLGTQKSEFDVTSRWAGACIDVISRSVANVKWELYTNTSKGAVKIEQHQFLSLLNQFNNKATKYECLSKTAANFLTYGKAYWILQRATPDDKPTAIFVPLSSQLQPIGYDSMGYPISYSFTSSTTNPIGLETQIISASNVLEFKTPDGKSVVDSILDVLETDAAMMGWNKGVMQNNARIGGIFKVSEGLDENEIKALKAQLLTEYSGYGNSGKFLFLKNGTDFVPDSYNPKDLDFVNGRNANRDEILSAFGVPKILLGLESGYNRATAVEAERVFAKYTLEPLVEQLVETINEYLTPIFGQDLWLDFETLAPEDKEIKLMEWTAGFNKWLTANDIRRQDNLPDVVGGDSIYLTLAEVPTMNDESATQTKTLRASGKKVVTAKQKNIASRIESRNARYKLMSDDITAGIMKKVNDLQNKGKVVVKIKEVKGYDRIKSLNKEAYWSAYVELKNKNSNSWKSTLNKLFTKQKEVILNKLDGKKSAEFKIAADELFNADEMTTMTMSIIKPEYYNSIMSGLGMGAELIGEQMDRTDMINNWVQKVAEPYIRSINDTTYNDLSKLIDDNQSDLQGLKDGIESYFTDVTPDRADMIARTESARALTAGEAMSWDGYGVENVEWYLAGSDPCVTCMSNSTKVWTIQQAEMGISEYSHPDCECLWLPII